ncbi:MAG: hypothetical protein BV457_07145 [Thermoplasmata archaeon M9B1D]|nr:MAG: hypothetical protein BV457_07145 [Thermoplasmata archaeon M9B1D]PNX50386.1 MAG: hypothetical protein BV456_06880 [Thermoplasmata archaeon M8B2D]
MVKNNAGFCTFDPDAPCSNCENEGMIFCKPDENKVIVSHLLEGSFILMALMGTGLTSMIVDSLWPVIVFSIFAALFFLVIQPRITCSHCPYYAEDRLFLHCTENHFSPKIWRYHPEPINWWEKIGTVVGFIFLGVYPLIIELYGIFISWNNSPGLVSLISVIGVFLGTILTLALFYIVFFLFYCPHCVNFSCVFNKVPEEYVKLYLERNPVMKKAWYKYWKS